MDSAMKLVMVGAVLAASAWAQAPDTILVNGKVLTVDARDSVQQAVAIREGRIAAVGTNATVRAMAGPATRVIDVGGRTVIPGLIDSHMHAIRAALSFSTEVNWIGARSMGEAMRRISEAAAAKPAGSWLIVAGGWTADQFAERRAPTQAELEKAAPKNPVYVQLGYSWALLNGIGYRTIEIDEEATLPAGARFERDADGKTTGAVVGGQNAIVALFDRLPKPTAAQQLEGTRLFFRELNRLGLTGVVDPGGNNLFPWDYEAVQRVWRDRQLSVRIAYALNGQTADKEFDDLRNLTQMTPMGFGDDFLKFNGIGERITFAMNNNDRPSDVQKEKYLQIARWAAEHGMALTMHWANNSSVNQLLDIFEQVNKDIPMVNLRWSIAHLGDATEATMRRMKALGVGWTVQDATYFGAGRGAAMPALNLAKRVGVAVGAGTDAHRVMSYNPFTAMQWLLDGKTVAGAGIGGMQEAPGREDALRLYTMGSAWFSRDEGKRGSIEAGKLADLAVLSKDYMTVAVDQVGTIESLLTMVGGKVVYGAGAFGALESR
ncbi:MAG: amidohydrolase [Acidobacteriota bacterium]